jgi:hypothetical protein
MVSLGLLQNPGASSFGCVRVGLTNKVQTFGLYYPYSESSLIQIIYLGIKNPSSTKATVSPFIIRTYDSLGNVICKSSEDSFLQATPGSLSLFEGSVKRSSFYVSSDSFFSFGLILSNPI